MKKKRMKEYKRTNFTTPCLVISLIFHGMVSTAQVAPLMVISNENGSPSSMKFSELKSIFMGEQQRWHNGTKITIALMKTNTSAGKNTSKKIYGMSGDELNRFWLALVFQGKAAAPNFFNSAAELENFVAQNAGAIGILDQVDPNNDIKTILVEGKKSL